LETKATISNRARAGWTSSANARTSRNLFDAPALDEGPFMPDPIARRVARRHEAAVHFLNMPATKTRVE